MLFHEVIILLYPAKHVQYALMISALFFLMSTHAVCKSVDNACDGTVFALT